MTNYSVIVFSRRLKGSVCASLLWRWKKLIAHLQHAAQSGNRTPDPSVIRRLTNCPAATFKSIGWHRIKPWCRTRKWVTVWDQHWDLGHLGHLVSQFVGADPNSNTVNWSHDGSLTVNLKGRNEPMGNRLNYLLLRRPRDEELNLPEFPQDLRILHQRHPNTITTATSG